MSRTLVIRGTEIDGAACDARIEGDRIAAIAPFIRPGPGDEVIDAHGGALIPGLHDHHVHLLAMAAATSSVEAGPPLVTDAAALAAALRTTATHTTTTHTGHAAWVRATGYHESVAGPLDRDTLDRLVPDRPVRVQHRSGAMWVLNSAALRAVGLDDHPTGRLFGQDEWLRTKVPAVAPDLAAVGAELSRYGVTGVTDATPMTDPGALELLAAATAARSLPQRVVITGGPGLDPAAAPALPRGPVKVILADHDLPPIGDVAGAIAVARQQRRPIALHCVTREALALAIAALGDAGSVAGDRIEHGAVIPPDMAVRVARLGLTVVTQPNFIRERGDQYLTDVDAADLPYLYPCASLLDAGIAVGGGTDAPFGHADPWRAIATAVDRVTAGGHVLGGAERVSARRALDLFLTPPEDPGGRPRRVVPGAPAELCLLSSRLADVLDAPSSDAVALTVQRGARWN